MVYDPGLRSCHHFPLHMTKVAPTPSAAQTVSHTPGPWIIVDDAGGYPGIEAEGQNIILNSDLGEHCGVRGASHDEALANARLIAAAPRLAKQLQALIDAFGEYLDVTC